MPKVGYSATTVGRATGSQKFNIYIAQFRNTNGDETQMKMKDVTCNQVYNIDEGTATGFQPGGDTVQFFTPQGNVMAGGVLSYASAEFIEGMFGDPETDKPGWYDSIEMAEGNFSNPKNEMSVLFGEGYIVKAGNGEGVLPTVTCSGEVKDGVTEIPSKLFSFAGNCTPVATTLASVGANQTYNIDEGTATGFQPGGDTIQFFTEDGKVKAGCVLSYASPEFIEGMFGDPETDKPGWYDSIEMGEGNFANPKNTTPLAAGEAFVLKTGNGEGVLPTITMPNPLAK